MDTSSKPTAPAEPQVLPDVATTPHPRGDSQETTTGNPQAAGQGLLTDALPEITEVARKVGGFKRLSEIAAQLDRDNSTR